MGLIDFLKGIGHVFGKVFGVIRKIVPEDQLIHAIELVKTAGEQFVDNAMRREWVVTALMTEFHVPESVARLMTEMAVSSVKRGVDVAAEKAEIAIESAPSS